MRLFAAVVGALVGWSVGTWVGWDPPLTAIGFLLLGLVVVDAWWAPR